MEYITNKSNNLVPNNSGRRFFRHWKGSRRD